jgi:putative ABC transport system substrate-binding protein
MKRREFIALVGGAAATWPIAARAQQPQSMKRLGVLLPSAADDPVYQSWVGEFMRGLGQLGWTEGQNVRIDYRWGGDSADALTRYAVELVALAPDVILTSGNQTVEKALQATHTVPIVFAIAADPVGSGFVGSLSRPGGNATGFMQYDYGLSAKWPELLKEIAPSVTRAAVLRDAAITAGIGQFAIIQYVAPSVGVEVSPINLRDLSEIERDVAAFANSPNGGLIITGSGFAAVHRDPIIAMAALHKLPAIYNSSYFATGGGLISYGANFTDQFRRAAAYVDRILRGEKPGNLPVQAPTKYELVINLRTAKALGLTVPPTLLARADKVIE